MNSKTFSFVIFAIVTGNFFTIHNTVVNAKEISDQCICQNCDCKDCKCNSVHTIAYRPRLLFPGIRGGYSNGTCANGTCNANVNAVKQLSQQERVETIVTDILPTPNAPNSNSNNSNNSKFIPKSVVPGYIYSYNQSTNISSNGYNYSNYGARTGPVRKFIKKILHRP